MKDPQVLIAKSQERAELYKCARDVLLNPAVLTIAGFVITEYLQGHTENGQRVAGGGFMGSIAGTALETGLAAYLVLVDAGKIAAGLNPIAKALGPLVNPGGE